MQYYNASLNPKALASARAYAERIHYRLCGSTLPTDPVLSAAVASEADDGTPTVLTLSSAGTVAPPGDASLCSAGMYQNGYSFFGDADGNRSAASAADCCALCQMHRCGFFTYRAAAKRCLLSGDAPTSVVKESGAAPGWSSSAALGPYGDKGSPPAFNASGPHNANNQLSGGVYVELYFADGNTSHLADAKAVYDVEIAEQPRSDNFWSWIDATFMTMNTLPRLAVATSESKYFEKAFVDYSAAALAPPNPPRAFGFWSAKDSLFWRDARFVNSRVFWGRGNAWAICGLVGALRYSKDKDPHYAVYLKLFTQMAAKLKAIVSKDTGAWGTSLLNAHDYPQAETTATAQFVHALAFGINKGLIDKAEYLSTVEKGWHWLATVALQPGGVVGFCQQVAGSPGSGFKANDTNHYGVGFFLQAASEVAKLQHASCVRSSAIRSALKTDDYAPPPCRTDLNPTINCPANATCFCQPTWNATSDVLDTDNILYSEKYQLKLHLFTPPASDQRAKRPVMLMIHGGGFVGGNKDDKKGIIYWCRRLAASGYVTASIDYRINKTAFKADSEQMMIDAAYDAKAAVRYLRKHASKLRVDTDRIGAFGSSAGAMTVAFMSTLPDDGDGGNAGFSSKIRAGVSLSGALVCQTKVRKQYCDYIEAINASHPPFLDFHGCLDTTVPHGPCPTTGACRGAACRTRAVRTRCKRSWRPTSTSAARFALRASSTRHQKQMTLRSISHVPSALRVSSGFRNPAGRARQP